jgi:hypothetical protein
MTPSVEDRDGDIQPEISVELQSTVDKIGSVEVFQELKTTIHKIRTGDSNKLCPFEKGDGQNLNDPSYLKRELETTEMGEQICKLKKRIALSTFYRIYTEAQDEGQMFLENDANSSVSSTSAHTRPGRSGVGTSSLVKNTFIDSLFPETRDLEEGASARKAAAKKVEGWRRNGKLWAAMIDNFGEGILVLIPRRLSNELFVPQS